MKCVDDILEERVRLGLCPRVAVGVTVCGDPVLSVVSEGLELALSALDSVVVSVFSVDCEFRDRDDVSERLRLGVPNDVPVLLGLRDVVAVKGKVRVRDASDENEKDLLRVFEGDLVLDSSSVAEAVNPLVRESVTLREGVPLSLRVRVCDALSD